MTIPPYDLRADDFRTYQLPDSLDTSIPATAQPDEPALHWIARGLITETCQRLLARPITLEYIEHDHTIFIAAIVSLASTILSTDPPGDLASVNLVLVKHTSRWALIYQDRIIATGRSVPPPRYLADLVHTDHAHRRTAQTDTCRGPADPPSHLW